MLLSLLECRGAREIIEGAKVEKTKFFSLELVVSSHLVSSYLWMVPHTPVDFVDLPNFWPIEKRYDLPVPPLFLKNPWGHPHHPRPEEG